MPQLEIHHADGNVTYAQLTSEKPLMVGSGANCDVVLSDPGVKRVHCRLVCRDDRWRVEVAADAGTVQLGGKQVKAGTIRSGDVLGIGSCRIYVDEGKSAEKPTSLTSEIAAQMVYESTDHSESIEQEAAEKRHLGRSTVRKASHMKDTRSVWIRMWDGFRNTAKDQFKGEVDRPPGQERILGSPLVRWMLVGLVVIVAAGIYFFIYYRNKQIMGLLEAAQKSVTDGNYELAMKRFENFYETYPHHEFASSAKVQRALCEVEANVVSAPAAALADTRKLIREQSKEPGFGPLKDKIAETVGRVAQNLAEIAHTKADRKPLDQSEEALEVIRRDLQGTQLTADAQAKLAATVAKAEAAIAKYNELNSAIESMDRAITDARTSEVYRLRERLIQLYDDFKDKTEIVDRMEKAQKMDLEAIRWEVVGKNAENQGRTSGVSASIQLMEHKGSAIGSAAGNVQFMLSGGVLFALDGNAGQTLWSYVVGRDTNHLPILLGGSGEPAVLISDTRHDELVAVESKSGKIVWRQPLGEPIESAPLLHRGKLYQPAGKGSLFVIDANSGRIDGRMKFGEQRLATTPVADMSGAHLFLLGEQYLLYVITLGGVPKCDDIYYTAHRPDSIIASPLRMLRYLVLCENSTANTVRMRVFLLKPDGTMDSEMQRLPAASEPAINGWIHQTPAAFHNLIFVATDLETVYVYSGGSPEKADGFTPVPVKTAIGGTAPPGTRPQAFALYYTEKDLLVHGSMVRHYEYAAEKQQLTPTAEKLPGATSQPIQRFPTSGGKVDAVYVARRVPNSSSISFTAIDPTSLDTKWEITLGSGILSLLPIDASKNSWVALTRSGHVFAIPAGTLTSGGVLDKPAGRIEIQAELSDQAEPLVLPNGSSIYTPVGTPNRLFIRPAAPGAAVRPMDLLAPLQAPVVLLDDGILVPATDGRIYWLSPETGKALADPFQPPLDAEKPAHWRGVALTAKKTIIAVDDKGNIFQVEPRKGQSTHLGEKAASKFAKPIRSGIAVAGSLVGCVDETNVLHVWDAETMSPVSEIKLSSPAALGPIAAGGHLFVVAGDDEMVCVDPQGKEAWRFALKGENVAGRPLVKGDSVHFVTTSGLVRALRLANGSELGTVDTERSLSGGPIDLGDKFVVIGEDGSLNVVKTPGTGN